jgi:hypothetical protein
MQPIHQAEEGPLPLVPGQQAVDQSSSASHDLARHLDECCTKCRKLHPQQLGFLG